MKKYINKMNPDKLNLTRQIGDGAIGESKFNLSSMIPSGTLIVEFEDTKQKAKGKISRYRYSLDSKQFIMDCHEQYLKDKKE